MSIIKLKQYLKKKTNIKKMSTYFLFHWQSADHDSFGACDLPAEKVSKLKLIFSIFLNERLI